jgi:hypothetical protein
MAMGNVEENECNGFVGRHAGAGKGKFFPFKIGDPMTTKREKTWNS